MDKYMEISKDCGLYRDYFEWVGNLERIRKLFNDIKDKYGIEADAFYHIAHKFENIPIQKDNEKFKELMKKTSYGELKKNTSIYKEWIDGVKEIGRIQKPQLIYYFNLLGYRWSEELFHIEDKLYCSIKSDGDVSTPEFATEMKASEFYKIIKESVEKNETQKTSSTIP